MFKHRQTTESSHAKAVTTAKGVYAYWKEVYSMHIVSTHFSHYVVFALYNICCSKYGNVLDFYEVTEMLLSAFVFFSPNVQKMSPPLPNSQNISNCRICVPATPLMFIYRHFIRSRYRPPWICLSGLDAHRKTLISWPHTQ